MDNHTTHIPMKGYVGNIEKATKENAYFRKVLYTGQHSQLVVMSIEPGEDIGEEMHELDQFIRVESGKGRAVLNKTDEYDLEDGFAVIVPAGAWHNIVNTGEEPLKLYTLYSPPEHKDGTVHATREDQREEHFDGKTTE